MFIVIAVLLGAGLALLFDFYIPAAFSPYVAIFILASADSLLGACYALQEKKFHLLVFVTGFFGNSLIATCLIFIGKWLGLDLYLAAVVVFVMRIFQNFAKSRRHLLQKYIAKPHGDAQKNNPRQEI